MKIVLLAATCLIILSSCHKDDDNQNKATVTDVDGNVYHTVKIGTQVWMVENLKTTKYRNGDLIGTTTPETLEITNESKPKYQWAYAYNEDNIATYGRLYTWYAVTDSRNLCPEGWYVSSEAEWMELETYIGDWYVDAVKLKEVGTEHWVGSNEGATNETGFTALPGGECESAHNFEWIQYYGFWWTTTESGTYGNAIARLITGTELLTPDTQKYFGFSVRCLKD
jgi:uncharacterized protein (TIGR02145 family)